MAFITCWLMRSVLVRLLVTLSLTIALVDAVGTEKACAVGQSVTLAFSHRINKTGHALVKGQLEQSIGDDWQLNVDLKKSTSGPDKLQKNVFSFELTTPTSIKGASPKKQSPPGYTLREPFGYFRLGAEALPWEEAKDACTKEGAHLAFATSKEEALMYTREFDFNVTNTINSNRLWYGVSDIAEEGTYITTTGVPLNKTGYADFDTESLTGNTTNNCIFLNKDSSLLDDYKCSTKRAYICKVDL